MNKVRVAAILAFPAAWLLAGCASQMGDTESGEVVTQQRTVALAEWDEDNNGALSEEEFADWWEEEGMMGMFDEDGDDELSEDEITTGLFETWDEDDDDVLSESEWNAAKETWFPEADGGWDDWDSDGDSELDLNEVSEGLEFDGVYGVIDTDQDAIFDDEEFADFFFDTFDLDDDDEIDTTEWDDFGEA